MANHPWSSSPPLSLHIDTSRAAPNHSLQDFSNVPQSLHISRPYRSLDPITLQPIEESPYDKVRTWGDREVVKDMYDGQDPPKYRSQSSPNDLRQSSSSVTPARGRPCDSCGRQRSVSGSNDHTSSSPGECHKCGKQRANTDHSAHTAMAPQSRSVSEGSTTTLVDPGNSNSTEDGSPASRSKCSKCGKAKRPPVSTSSAHTSLEREASLALPPSRHVASQHIMYTDTSKPATRTPSDMPRRKPVPSNIVTFPVLNSAIDIDIVPPTAASERPSSIFQLPNVDKSPLLHRTSQSQTYRPYKPARTKSIASIASSISRSLSRRRSRSKENTEGRQPSPQPNQNNDQGPATLLSLITNAFRGNETKDYSKIDAETEADTRPDSPFSFTDRAGDDSIQLNDISKSRHNRADHWEEVEIRAPHSEPLRSNPFDDPQALQRPEYTRVRSDVLGNRLEALPVPSDDLLPANPQRPAELVRFKSLRSGVQRAGTVAQRAGSIARSTSLKRLNSLKNAPQYWYRTDMAIEGAMVGVF